MDKTGIGGQPRFYKALKELLTKGVVAKEPRTKKQGKHKLSNLYTVLLSIPNSGIGILNSGIGGILNSGKELNPLSLTKSTQREKHFSRLPGANCPKHHENYVPAGKTCGYC